MMESQVGSWLYPESGFIQYSSLGWGRSLLPICCWPFLLAVATSYSNHFKIPTERSLKNRGRHGGGEGKFHTAEPSRPMTEEKLVPFSHHGPQTPGERWPLTVAFQENPRKTGLS